MKHILLAIVFSFAFIYPMDGDEKIEVPCSPPPRPRNPLATLFDQKENQDIPISTGDFRELSDRYGSLPFTSDDDDIAASRVYEKIKSTPALKSYLEDHDNLSDGKMDGLIDCLVEDDAEHLGSEHKILSALMDPDGAMNPTSKYLYMHAFHIIFARGWDHYIEIRKKEMPSVILLFRPIEWLIKFVEKRHKKGRQ